MTIQELIKRLQEKRQVVSVVGGGGKSTLISYLASCLAEDGRKVLVTTTTHIFFPESCVYASDIGTVRKRWAKGSYAVIGQPEPQSGKLAAPSQTLFSQCMVLADTVLIEADGAKRMPCKVPAAHEPVILPETDLVIGVAGLSCLGKRLRDCCFRWELFSELWKENPFLRGGLALSDIFSGKVCMTEEALAALLSSSMGTRKGAGDRSYVVVLNQCDTESLDASADRITVLLKERGVSEVISASLKREFGKKLG